MNRLLVVSLGITVAALAVGFALGTQFQFISNSETTSATTTTGTTVSTICAESAQSGVLVHLVNEYGGPIVGDPVSSYTMGSCGNLTQVTVNPVNVTNSSGWADLRYGQVGNYYVSVGVGSNPTTYYNFTVPTMPLAVSIVTYNLYSGNMTVHFCGGFFTETTAQCNPYNP
jgi:hypothetical protein